MCLDDDERRGGAPGRPGRDEDERHRLTALEGLAALSLDALSSVAYGPEAILVVPAAAGLSALKYTMPITIAIVVLLAVLVTSYRRSSRLSPSTSAGWCWTGPSATAPTT